MDLGDKVSKEEFCSDDVKSALDKWATEPVEDMEAGRKSLMRSWIIFQLPKVARFSISRNYALCFDPFVPFRVCVTRHGRVGRDHLGHVRFLGGGEKSGKG